MMETIKVKGKTFSVETVVEALQKHCNFEEEKGNYVFQVGDVAINPRVKEFRIICIDGKGGIMSINMYGTLESTTQDSFEFCNYKKIGVLTDFIKKEC